MKTHGFPSDLSLDLEGAIDHSDFKIRGSSTGGRVPLYGPRRMILPSRVLSDDFILKENKFHVSESEVTNYKAICALEKSRYSK